MPALPAIERKGPIGLCRLAPLDSSEEALALVTEAVEMARRMGVSGLAVMFPDMASVLPPTVVSRLEAIGNWARVSTGLVRVAVVAPRHFLDSAAYGVVHAAQLGLILRGFERELDALVWLLELAEAEKP